LKIEYLVVILIVSGILIGMLIGGFSFNPGVENIETLREENRQLKEELVKYQTTLSEQRLRLDWLQAIENGTIQMPPPPKIVEEISVEEIFSLIGKNASMGSIYYESSYCLTTQKEIENFLSFLANNPSYQKSGNEIKTFIAFASLIKWEKRLAIGFIVQYFRTKFLVVIVVKEENDSYGVYKIVGERLEPFDKMKPEEIIYLPP